MTRVVAAIDNSAAARSVLGVGQAVAPALGADLEAVHVLEDGHETAVGLGRRRRPLPPDPVRNTRRRR